MYRFLSKNNTFGETPNELSLQDLDLKFRILEEEVMSLSTFIRKALTYLILMAILSIYMVRIVKK